MTTADSDLAGRIAALDVPDDCRKAVLAALSGSQKRAPAVAVPSEGKATLLRDLIDRYRRFHATLDEAEQDLEHYDLRRDAYATLATGWRDRGDIARAKSSLVEYDDARGALRAIGDRFAHLFELGEELAAQARAMGLPVSAEEAARWVAGAMARR